MHQQKTPVELGGLLHLSMRSTIRNARNRSLSWYLTATAVPHNKTTLQLDRGCHHAIWKNIYTSCAADQHSERGLWTNYYLALEEPPTESKSFEQQDSQYTSIVIKNSNWWGYKCAENIIWMDMNFVSLVNCDNCSKIVTLQRNCHCWPSFCQNTMHSLLRDTD